MPIYTYQQLKGRIKVGDTVINEGEKKKVTEVYNDGFRLEGDTPLRFFDWHKLSLELLEEKTLDTVDVGDVVFHAMGIAYVILDTSKNGTILFLANSESGMLERFASRSNLKEGGFTVKQPKPVRKMTRAEVEKLVGEPIEIVEE